MWVIMMKQILIEKGICERRRIINGMVVRRRVKEQNFEVKILI